MPASRLAGSRLKVSSRTSTNTGTASNQATTSAVAANVKDGTSTACPGLRPLTMRAKPNASVPLAQLSTCLAPQKAASSCSKTATSGPMMYLPWSTTRRMASSMRRPRRRRCAPKSMNSIGASLACKMAASGIRRSPQSDRGQLPDNGAPSEGRRGRARAVRPHDLPSRCAGPAHRPSTRRPGHPRSPLRRRR